MCVLLSELLSVDCAVMGLLLLYCGSFSSSSEKQPLPVERNSVRARSSKGEALGRLAPAYILLHYCVRSVFWAVLSLHQSGMSVTPLRGAVTGRKCAPRGQRQSVHN